MKFVIFPQLLGSDQFLPIDGRIGIARIMKNVEDHIDKIQIHHNQRITKAELYTGDRISNSVKIKEWTI